MELYSACALCFPLSEYQVCFGWWEFTLGCNKEIKLHSPHFIVAVDIKCEEFKEVPLPLALEHRVKNFEIGVALLGRDLCIHVSYSRNKRVSVWVMRAYRKKESWCNLFTLYHLIEYGVLMWMRPLAYSRDGKKVLLEVDWKRLYLV